MSHRDPSLAQLARIHIDGVPVDLGSRLLPRRTKLRPGLGLHIAAHGAAVRRASGRRGPSRAFSERALRGLIASLRRAVSGLKAPRGGRWSGYYEDVDHYPEAALADKARIVGEMCRAVKPGTVWDLGANTGRFSSIAAEHATLVVAIDADHASVEEAYVSGRARGDRRVLPLVGDLTNPSPPLGWAGAERASLADRGPADLVMALALIHHLAIGNNVPLEMVADHLADLGRAAIVEFVPKSDPMVGRLLTGRRDVFASYTEDGFRHAFERRFGIARAESIAGTSRTLFLMRQR